MAPEPTLGDLRRRIAADGLPLPNEEYYFEIEHSREARERAGYETDILLVNRSFCAAIQRGGADHVSDETLLEEIINGTEDERRADDELRAKFEGHILRYEGDDPEGFRAQVKAEFGFDPADDFDSGAELGREKWGEWVETKYGELLQNFRFLCPPEHLEAIYGAAKRLQISP